MLPRRILCVSTRILLPGYFHTSSLWVTFFFCGKGPLDLYSKVDSLSPLTPSAAYNSLSPNRSVVGILGSFARTRVRTQTARFCWTGQSLPPNHCCSPSALNLRPRAMLPVVRQTMQSSVHIIKSARACGEAIYHIIRRRRLGIQRLGFANSFKLFLRPVPVLYSAAHGA